MLFPLLFNAARSEGSQLIAELDDSSFNTVVSHRKNTSVIMVMFYSAECEKSAALAPVFEEAAGISDGLVQYARANVNNASHTAKDFHITSTPSFIAFYQGGRNKMFDAVDPTAKKIVQFTDRLLPKLAQTVDECWAPTAKQTCIESAAILFSSKKFSPPMWNGISGVINHTFLPIGFCNNPNITKDFNVTDVPSIGFLHNKVFKQYTGNKTFNEVIKAIKEEFPDLAIPRPTPTPYPRASDHVSTEGIWEATCKRKKYCVIEAKSNTTEEFVAFSKNYITEPFKFISCGETCPWPEMQDGYWVFHTKLDRAMYAPDYDELKLHLSRFLAGSPKWTNRLDLLAEVGKLNENSNKNNQAEENQMKTDL